MISSRLRKKTIYIKKRSLLIYIWLLILQKNILKFLQLIIKFNARVYFCTTQIKFVSLLSIIWKYVRMRSHSWCITVSMDLVPRRRIACLANETRSNRNRFFATDFFWMKEDRDMEANDLVNDELSSTWQLDRRDATRSDVITWRKVRNAGRQVCARQWRCTLNEASHLTTLVGESSIKDR